MKFTGKLESLIKALRIKSDPETKERVLGDALSAVKKIKADQADKEQQGLRQIVLTSRAVKFAAVAVIVLAVLAGIQFFGGRVEFSSVVWAEVAQNVKRIENFTYRLKTVMTGFTQEETRHVETRLYFSEYGVRLDIYEEEQIKTEMLIHPSENSLTTIIPDARKYVHTTVTDERLRKMYQENDPRELVKRFMSLDYTKLGRKVIEGIEVEGVEVDDPEVAGGMLENAVGRLWVDVMTDLPVQIELEGLASGGKMQMTMLAYDFQWDAELTREDFELNIPADFTEGTEAAMPETNEQKAIEGLREFAEITDGGYPSDLALMTTMRELVQVWKEKHGRKPGIEEHQMLMRIGTVCQFYSDVTRTQSEAAYYGDRVMAADPDAVLMRWKVTEDEYRVIFGDLHTENVSAEILAQLETE